LSAPRKKHFDTSGKSPALVHLRAICQTPTALPDNGRFGAIAGKKTLPQLKSHRLATANDRLRVARARFRWAFSKEIST